MIFKSPECNRRRADIYLEGRTLPWSQHAHLIQSREIESVLSQLEVRPFPWSRHTYLIHLPFDNFQISVNYNAMSSGQKSSKIHKIGLKLQILQNPKYPQLTANIPSFRRISMGKLIPPACA